MARLTPAARLRAAEEALLELLKAEYSCGWDEIEAKLTDGWQGYPPFDPHVLTNAKRLLARSELIVETTERTRGGREVTTWARTDLPRSRTAIAKAAQRKRLLIGRYLSWTTGTEEHPELIGRTGEAAAHRLLLAAASENTGLHPVNPLPTTRDLRHLFGTDLLKEKGLGPLDDGAWLHLIDAHHTPLPPVFVPVEVKNRRDWIYPVSAQLHQLLHKAAWLATTHPDHLYLPLLVARRSNYVVRAMAEDLGFFVLQTQRQPITWPQELPHRLLEEVRDELGYSDLTTDIAPPERLVATLAKGLPKLAHKHADRWARFGPALLPVFELLRRDTLDEHERAHYGDELRHRALEAGAAPGLRSLTRW